MLTKQELQAELESLGKQQEAAIRKLEEQQAILQQIAGAGKTIQHLLGKLAAKEAEKEWPFAKEAGVRIKGTDVLGTVKGCRRERPDEARPGREPGWVCRVQIAGEDGERQLGAEQLERHMPLADVSVLEKTDKPHDAA